MAAPAGVAPCEALLPSVHCASGTATARSASITQPVVTGKVAPRGSTRRSTTQRSGSGGSARRLLAPSPVCLKLPRSSASGMAQCRCTPGSRGVPASKGSGMPSSAFSAVCPLAPATSIGSRTIASVLPLGT
jgi:hypothetical protein